MEANIINAKACLSELGNAIRCDHNNFNGLEMHNQLECIAYVLDGKMNLDDFRVICNLCPNGFSHWTKYCDKNCDIQSDSDSYGYDIVPNNSGCSDSESDSNSSDHKTYVMC